MPAFIFIACIYAFVLVFTASSLRGVQDFLLTLIDMDDPWGDIITLTFICLPSALIAVLLALVGLCRKRDIPWNITAILLALATVLHWMVYTNFP